MNEGNLSIVEPGQPSPATSERSLGALIRVGGMLARSGFFADAREEAQAVTKILYGQELGLGPVASLMGIEVVEGKLSVKPATIAALIQRSGRFSYRERLLTGEACEVEFYEGPRLLGVASFSLDDARRAGLVEKSNWRRYPKAMLWARAMSEGARHYCPSLFQGAVSMPEEFASEQDPRTGSAAAASASRDGHPVDAATGEILEPVRTPQDLAGPGRGPDPNRDIKALFAHARELGYRKRSEVHAVFGLASDAGALSAHVSDAYGGDWAMARRELDRLHARRAGQSQSQSQSQGANPDADAFAAFEEDLTGGAEAGAAVERCFGCGAEMSGYDAQGRPVCDAHAQAWAASMPEAGAIPVSPSLAPSQSGSLRQFRGVAELLTAAHKELDLLPTQIDRVLGSAWRSDPPAKLGERWAALEARKAAQG